ncbi:AIPR family protein [Streptosporangium sp. NPDC049376]|uniref:AIPR family protein n=1 Tax=Streptosporangium sp. NPDC049376 TaxID=3366192 RepID=UPI00379A95DE
MSVLHVRHIEEELKRSFDGLIDLTDVAENAPQAQREAQFLSRALAAYVAQQVTGRLAEEAAAFVIDGRDDNGIDAVAIDGDKPHLWLIQSKWAKAGEGTIDKETTLKLKEGLDLLLEGEYGSFNPRFAKLEERIDAALGDPSVKITLMLVVLGDPKMEDVVERPLLAAAKKLNGPKPEDEVLDIRTLGLHDVHKMVRAKSAPARIDLSVTLDGAGRLQEPYLAYYGSVSVGQVARWYGDHEDSLFEQNIRKSLGLTGVNRSLVDTLITRPHDFWYFNNGITVLCDRVRPTVQYATSDGGPREFKLEGSSVVNGAQTVAAINEGLRRAPDKAGAARVWIRLISLEDCPEGFADQITRATNTQNQVGRRDLAALDEVQVRLREEFAWALGHTYVIKGGDDAPEGKRGCTNVEAAEALACTHARPELTVQAKAGGDYLWERNPGSAYDQLFPKKISVYRVWRSVVFNREVGAALDEGHGLREGLTARVAEHGRSLITHITFRILDQSGINDLQSPWEDTVLPAVPERTATVLAWLVHHVEELGGYPVSIFKNPEKCRSLAASVIASVNGQAPPPEIQVKKRSSRAVGVLVDAGVIEEGAVLEFRVFGDEQAGMNGWIAKDPKRGRATWVNSRSKPLIWEADGQPYSPTTLTAHMRLQALGKKGAVQGTKYWSVRGRSLVELAEQVRNSE